MNDPWPPAKQSALIFLHNDGLSMTYMGRLMGISRDSIAKAMKRLELEPCVQTSQKLGNSIRWDSAQEATLTRLWDEGISHTKIASELGLSRSAVQSKTKRLGLPPRTKPAVTPKPDNHRRAPVSVSSVTLQAQGNYAAIYGGGIIRSIHCRLNHHGQIVKPRPELPASNFDCAVSVLDAQPWNCRFPIGDEPLGPKFYCGHPIHTGSYCKEHAALCYRAPQTSHTRPIWKFR